MNESIWTPFEEYIVCHSVWQFLEAMGYKFNYRSRHSVVEFQNTLGGSWYLFITNAIASVFVAIITVFVVFVFGA